MPTLPQIPTQTTYNDITDAFAGYNHNLKIADGEYYNTQNLTTEYYPLMADRRKRGKLAGIPEDVGGLIDKDELYFVAAGSLYRRGNTIALMSGLTPGEKQLVSMGAYLCIFPDMMYYNTADGTDYGSMQRRLDGESGGPMAIWSQRIDGKRMTVYAFSSLHEEDRKNYLKFLKEFSPGGTVSVGGSWMEQQGFSGDHIIYSVKLEDGTIPTKKKNCDPTTGKGTDTGAEDGTSPFIRAAYNGDGTTTIYRLPENAWSIKEITVNSEVLDPDDWTFTAGSAYVLLTDAPDEGNNNVTIAFKPKDGYGGGSGYFTFLIFDEDNEQIPDYPQPTGTYDYVLKSYIPVLDFVCEAQNRLWGCRYGNVGNRLINELYCCALGDFSKWDSYEGTSMDSWTASVGSDGPWTGCINYMGYPTFFKEDRLHRIVISPIGAHEVTETACRGVQEGSWRSLQIVNETLYYKSPLDVCAYQGGFPSSVSQNLGDVKYDSAVAGVFGDRYYISMKDTDGAWSLFVFDTARGLWMREDATQAISFATVGNELYCAPASGGILALQGTDGEPERIIEWFAESGILYYQYPNRKYISRFNLKLQMEKGARMRIFLEYDSSGRWEKSGEIIFQGTNTIMIPVRPRRCDHVRIRIEGMGRMKIFQWARVLEIGSDY